MPLVRMADGMIVEMPDTAGAVTPTETLTDKLKFAGTALGRGLGNAMLGLAEGGLGSGQLDPKTLKPVPLPVFQKLREQFDTALPPNVTDPKEGAFWANTALEGAGGAASAGPQLLSTIPKALTTLTSGASANSAAALSDRFTEDLPEPVRDTIRTISALLAGAGTPWAMSHAPGMKTGPDQLALSPAQSAVNDAAKGGDFAAARQNVDKFANVGSKTATLAEALPDRPKLTALATESAQSSGGEQLANRVAGRGEDLKKLGDEFLNRVNPPVSTAQVANGLADAANAAKKNLVDLRTEAITNRLKGKQIGAVDTSRIFQDLLTEAKKAKRQNLEDAYTAVAERLLAKNKKTFLTDLQAISLNLKELKANPPTEFAATGRKINSQDVAEAIKRAEQKLGDYSPDFQQAMEEFAKFSQGPIQRMQEGRIGAVADVNPNVPKPTPQARVDTLVQGLPPTKLPGGGESVEGIMRELSTPQFTGGKPVNPAQIARAMFQRDLEKGSTNPGQTVRGLPGSQQDAITRQLVKSAGRNPNEVMKPLETADLLQNFQGRPGNTGMQPQSIIAGVLRPFRTGGLLANTGIARKYHEEIAQLLSEPTAANLKRLQELAMFDPSLRRRIQLMSMAQPALQGEQ